MFLPEVSALGGDVKNTAMKECVVIGQSLAQQTTAPAKDQRTASLRARMSSQSSLSSKVAASTGADVLYYTKKNCFYRVVSQGK